MKKTLFDKVWDSHVVRSVKNGPDVLFIDRHMVHEVTSPVAFLGLKKRNIWNVNDLYFIFRLTLLCILISRGSANIDLEPKALGPNSILP